MVQSFFIEIKIKRLAKNRPWEGEDDGEDDVEDEEGSDEELEDEDDPNPKRPKRSEPNMKNSSINGESSNLSEKSIDGKTLEELLEEAKKFEVILIDGTRGSSHPKSNKHKHCCLTFYCQHWGIF
jgi:hypothetical protein